MTGKSDLSFTGLTEDQAAAYALEALEHIE